MLPPITPATAHSERQSLCPRTAARLEHLRGRLLDQAIVAETADLLTEQTDAIRLAFKPQNEWQDWLTSEIAVLMVRSNRGSRIERRLRDYASYRAILFWETDQKVEVATLADKLPRQPGKVVAQLRQTPTGCDWLLARWQNLARVEAKEWTDTQRTLAERLVGDTGADPFAPNVAAEQIAELTRWREQAVELDAINRELIVADLNDHGVPGLSRLRRDSRALHQQIKWYINQFHVDHTDRWDDPRRLPGTESYAAEARNDARQPHWSFAEPRSDATKPIAELPVLDEIDETKPTAPTSDQSTAKTKPTAPTEFTSTLAAATPQPPALQPVVIHDYSTERGYRERQNPRRSPAQQAAHRQKVTHPPAALECNLSW